MTAVGVADNCRNIYYSDSHPLVTIQASALGQNKKPKHGMLRPEPSLPLEQHKAGQ